MDTPNGYTDAPQKEGVMTATLENISKADETAGTVLAGVVWQLMKDPHIIAMAEQNDKQRFIDGCQNSPQFKQKVAMALLQIREAALAA